jgi:hypothetical protein
MHHIHHMIDIRAINAVQNLSDVNLRFHTLKKKLKAFQAHISQISVSQFTSR